ncbi:hypothetical protein A1O3_03638 [Capronia epimyces CBS 606.96]|uniref:Xylanolytic transcriptional activator regulatory domain-containing protein n=1 Tax=Capronia epimyces CBS 606.96 TaxID=1182542 RepID=W9YAJ9_9EURO|nr:uncharacterized protein A1O3_03638 [Capronia epimyces CBS 606.96]EXJ86685.1 hypothetical protein A1O3_03638 [Capronia epimyces CBS 606.96]
MPKRWSLAAGSSPNTDKANQGLSLILTVIVSLTPSASPNSQEVVAPGTGTGCLPPHEEIIEACQKFTNCYFQVGFLPKLLFMERLEKDATCINQFLLLCILGVSARFTPSLLRRYGGPAKATRFFVAQAEKMVPTEIYKPTLDTLQGFILLGSAEWACEDRDRSLIHLGVASTMAGMLRLHREETYRLPDDAKPEDVINAEMARRTLWVMGMQSNLFSGNKSPVPFSLQDMTALLPCEENEFAFGLTPAARAALPGSQAAIDHPELVNCPTRSLFASLIQAHSLWGRVARRACLDEPKLKCGTISLWDGTSEYSQLLTALNQWEANLPAGHKWSEWYLRMYQRENLDLAYVSIFMALRLSNIVLRRTHLESIKAAMLSADGTGPPIFWENVSQELFTNVLSLWAVIKAYLSNRPAAQGFPPLLAFSVYLCGSSATHLWKCPPLCPRLALEAESVVHWSLRILVELEVAWPMATRWHQALQRTAAGLAPLDIPGEVALPKAPRSGFPAVVFDKQNWEFGLTSNIDGSALAPAAGSGSVVSKTTHAHAHAPVPMSTGGEEEALPTIFHQSQSRAHRDNNNNNNSSSNPSDLSGGGGTFSLMQPDYGAPAPFEDFQAELASYFQGDVQRGIPVDWNIYKN